MLTYHVIDFKKLPHRCRMGFDALVFNEFFSVPLEDVRLVFAEVVLIGSRNEQPFAWNHKLFDGQGIVVCCNIFVVNYVIHSLMTFKTKRNLKSCEKTLRLSMIG